MQLSPEPQADLDAAVADTTEAFRRVSASLIDDTQRQQLLFPLDGVERTTGRDTALPKAFCAVLAWCVPGWGLALGSLSFEQRTAFKAHLLTALGPTGYETVSAIRNRHNLIGVLEESANTKVIEAAKQLAPGRRFDDLRALVSVVSALQASGAALPPEAGAATAIGGVNPGPARPSFRSAWSSNVLAGNSASDRCVAGSGRAFTVPIKPWSSCSTTCREGTHRPA